MYGDRCEAPLSVARQIWLLADRCREEAICLLEGAGRRERRVLERYFDYFEAHGL